MNRSERADVTNTQRRFKVDGGPGPKCVMGPLPSLPLMASASERKKMLDLHMLAGEF